MINLKIQLQLTSASWSYGSVQLKIGPKTIAAGNKVAKPKHNIKIHLFGGISRLGLTPLRMFTGKMKSIDVQTALDII